MVLVEKIKVLTVIGDFIVQQIKRKTPKILSIQQNYPVCLMEVMCTVDEVKNLGVMKD